MTCGGVFHSLSEYKTHTRLCITKRTDVDDKTDTDEETDVDEETCQGIEPGRWDEAEQEGSDWGSVTMDSLCE